VKISIEEKKPGTYVITLEGEMDMSTSPDVRDHLVPIFRKEARSVIVDLSGVSYTDSSGIATLVEGLQLSRKGNVDFALVGVRPSVEAVFELAYLKDVFKMVPQLEQVLEGG